MLTFNFATAQRILFGKGQLTELGRLAAGYGRRVVLVTGGRALAASGMLSQVEKFLSEAGLEWTRTRVPHEPTVELVDEAVSQAGQFQAEAIIAIGGGSVIDAGKAIAALLANGGQCLDYLEGVGRGKHLTRPSRPFIAVPTTAGTGSEATKNAVIGDAAHTFKKSLRSDWMLPAVALVDPSLTRGCPPDVAAACGMDALTQLLEAFTSRRANPLVDTLAGLGLGMISHLPRLVSGEGDDATYEALALASLLGGMSLANAGLGAVHGLASPMGAFFPIPHGVVCAALLPSAVAANARRAAREGNRMLLEKYAAAAIQLIENQTDNPPPEFPFEDLAAHGGGPVDPSLDVALSLAGFLKGLVRYLKIPGLAHYGITPEDFPRIIAGARGTSMTTNPVTLDDTELAWVLMEAL